MTKANITEYDNTAANNTDVQDVPLGENLMYPSHVNNAFREIMADLADINDGTVSLTSPSASSITISGGSITGITDLAVADGGTGASTAEAARANLDVDPAGTAVALAIALG